ncbi:MAG: DUF2785 domain-containing protein [Proteobacteria bacterium]|nr:DUF2785 domain-containing protein [Pseudomonadota bacterium]
MHLRYGWLLAGLLAVATPLAAHAGCPPEGQTLDTLKQLKAFKFQTSDAKDQKKLAMGLLECLGDPDPYLRDEIAFPALQTWLRAGAFDTETLRGMRDALYAQLAGDDAQGFVHPYAALALSEIARTDRIKPWMNAEERADMVAKASDYFASISDYRAFDDKQGYRHAVAHGADWLWQLALDPATDAEQANRMLAALATQIVPDAAPTYGVGEPGRMARAVLAIVQRGFFTQKDWDHWFGKLIERIGDPAKAWNDSQWLARRHDLMGFLLSLYIDVDQSQDANIHFLKPSVVEAVKNMP